MNAPTVGRIVHYRLSEQDAERANQQQAPDGNTARRGDVLPAVVVRVFGDTLSVNLQVFLDGPDTLWVTSRGYSVEAAGCWFWPPRIDMTREGR